MPTLMFVMGLAMMVLGVLFIYMWAKNPGKALEGASAFESSDFPNIGILIQGFALFAFGTFLFALGLGWMLAGTAS